MMKKMMGFTLAEVLTTLMVIGVVAAMTIPTLMNSTNDQQLKDANKKAMSVLGQGVQLMTAKEVECKVQNDADLAECFANNVLSGSTVKTDKDNSQGTANVVATSDGMAYAFYYFGATDNDSKRNIEDICGIFSTDTSAATTTIANTPSDYAGKTANCIVVVDVNGFNKGTKGLSNFSDYANATDQQGIIITGNGVRPIYSSSGSGNTKGYQWMFGESAKPFTDSAE